MSIACDVVACGRNYWTQVPLHYRALFVFRSHIKCVLSQRAFGLFCEKFHIPEEVHPVLPDRDNTMHERPVEKIGLYTRFFDFANFRLPLSTFLVDIFSVCGIKPTVGLFRCFYVNSKKNGWMSFIKRSKKSHNVTSDPAPKATNFSAQDYAILVDHPSPFRKFLEEFLCLVGLSRHYTLDKETYPLFVDKDREDTDTFAFIRTPDPTKVKVVERERHEGEPRLLEVTVGRTVPLLPVAPDRGESELAASVDKLFDEGGVPSRHRKRKTVVVDTGGPSPPKKLREDYETPGGPSVAGKSRSAVQRLNLRTVSAPQRFVISLDSSHHSGSNIAEAEVDSFARPSVPIITAATTVTLTFGPTVVVQEKTVKPSIFAADFSFAGGDPNAGVFSDLTGSDFLVNGIRTVTDPEFDLQKVYVSRWSLTNGSRLDDGRVCREMVFLSAEVRMRAEYNIKEKGKLKTVEAKAAEAICLHAEASSFAATEKSLRDEVNALNGHNLILEKERDALDVKVTDLETVIVSKECELSDSNAQLTCIKSHNDNLANKVHELKTSSAGLQEKVTTYENCMEQLGKFQDERMKIVSDKLEKLDTNLVEMALHLEKKFYPHLLTVIAGRRWLLTHGMERATVKCLHSPEYLSALGEAISKAIEKGMQDGLAVRITHGQEGRVLTNVATYNPSTKADYISALQQLQSVNFSLLAELKSNKDASVETIMKILRLEESLAERLGLTGSQPHVDQLMVPIHHSRTSMSLVLLLCHFHLMFPVPEFG
ncbi:hypothetical protein Tco_0205150 [Tanacetum coccineum]